MATLPAGLRTTIWAIALPAATAIVTGTAALIALEDRQYANVVILAVYAGVMPGVALRNARALRDPDPT